MYKILVTSKELKLAAFVSLEIAEKFEEIYPAPLADYLTSLQSKISKADFISAEGRILHKLEYRVNYIPTSLTFQQRFYIILRLSKKQKILSSYILMASLTDKEIIYEYPSLVALASICLACKKIDSSLSKPQNARDCYFKDYQLEDCIKSFADIVPLEKETLSSKLLKIMKILKRVCERIISKPNRYKYALQLMPDKSVRNVLMSEFERQIKL